MKYLFLTVCCVVVFYNSKAQEALITLRDSVKIKTDLISMTDSHIKSKAGTFGIGEVYSVRFSSRAEAEKNPELLKQILTTTPIRVYENDKLIPSQHVPSAVAPAHQQKESVLAKRIIESQGKPVGSFGLGIGLDYGGFGGRFTLNPSKYVGIFAAGGYVVAGFGYNVGLTTRLAPDKRTVPIFSFMYGYNAAIKVSGAPQYDKIYYGPSIGFGLEMKVGRHYKNFWTVELIVPFRSQQFDTDINAIKNNPSISSLATPLPIAVSAGFHFGFFSNPAR
jgi:hypothetical protein